MLKRLPAILWLLPVAVLAAVPEKALAAGCAPAPLASCKTAGPQAPRDIEQRAGSNPVRFAEAPPIAGMRLCDIHFHRFAEHKVRGTVEAGLLGAERLASLGSGEGFVCRAADELFATRDELGTPAHREGCQGVGLGDTIEAHWVYTTCNVEPAPCLTSCFSDACANPQLRVEAQIFYLTDPGYPKAEDWGKEGYGSAPPRGGEKVEYLGSTTGGAYNKEDVCSPFQATWNVRNDCRPLTLASLDVWCGDNEFDEDHPHSVRKLVTALGELAKIP